MLRSCEKVAREFSKHIYRSKAWKQTREYIFKKYDGICQKCGAPGEEVHHKIFLRPSNIDDPEIVYGEDNLILLCKDCHFKEHEKTNPGFNNSKPKRVVENGCYFNDEGELVSQEVYIVYGAPASGKTTYVKQHMQDGDLVVDLDYIKYALTFRGKGELGDNLMPIAFDVRDMLYEKIEARDVDAKNIWIIASLPRKEERHRLATRLNAKLIHCHATVHECIDRAMNDIERVDKELQIKIIDKYFANYES